MQVRANSVLPALLTALALGWLAGSAPAAEYTVDPIHSSLLFRVNHLGAGNIYGRFNQFSGTFAFDPKNPAGCSLTMEVIVDSIDSANKDRDAHLKSNTFFNAKEFPKITFKSSKMKALDAKTYEVTGDFTLHGVTKSVTVKLERIGSATHPKTKAIITGFETTFTIKRSDFGMKALVPAIGDEVKIIFAAEGTRKP
jgi:polyisoprenoid-binding protein YceI